MNDQDDERLYKLDKLEWKRVMQRVKPDLTDEEYEQAWAEFVIWKERRQLN